MHLHSLAKELLQSLGSLQPAPWLYLPLTSRALNQGWRSDGTVNAKVDSLLSAQSSQLLLCYSCPWASPSVTFVGTPGSFLPLSWSPVLGLGLSWRLWLDFSHSGNSLLKKKPSKNEPTASKHEHWACKTQIQHFNVNRTVATLEKEVFTVWVLQRWRGEVNTENNSLVNSSGETFFLSYLCSRIQ